MQKDTALIIYIYVHCTKGIIWIGINSTPSTLCFYVYLPFHMRLNCSDKAHCSERKLVSDTFTFQEMRKFNLGGKWTWAHYALERECVFLFLSQLFFSFVFWITMESETSHLSSLRSWMCFSFLAQIFFPFLDHEESETSHLSSLRSRGRRLWECECRECQNSAGDRWWTPGRQY